MTPRNEATERQVQSARPDASTWLAANAGSGKTRVLTDRVARLLLNGVEPQHILCLTYTKAAASEMQNRLFKRLGAWAMLPDGQLADELRELGADRTDDADHLAQARTLFARALETPGGLKIQTIHSFCASLLRRFPLEARVSPLFAEMEDRAAALLRAEIVEDFADGPQSGVIDTIARHITDSDFNSLTGAIVGNRHAFDDPLNRDEILDVFGLPAGFDQSRLLGSVFLGGERDLLSQLCAVLATGGTMDQRAADNLGGIACCDLSDLSRLEKAFLTGAGAKQPYSAKIGTFPTKALRLANPELMDRVEPLMLRIEAARQQRLGLFATEKSEALHQFAAIFLPEYEHRKQQRGWLDFDDLIHKARLLLNDPAVAAWVLYRLDGGIDHILVDEAQDTSPAQWDVIEKLAQEFTSGQGARADAQRTIFVVGDKKQSIYSFQGADPQAFDQMQAEFAGRLKGIGAGLQNMTLEHSFRSSEIILRLVDLVFDGQIEAGFGGDGKHRAFKSDLPGRVDLWPVVDKVDDDDDRAWSDPVDRPGAQHHNVVLANRIAGAIKRMIDGGETIPVDGDIPGQFNRRPVQAGDFLILVQRRSDLFAEIIRACKSAKIPIAGADRLKVGAELAVKDLAALLSFLATPEDSLALAVVLKSPLFGWDEQALFDLAHRRDVPYLWQALRSRADEFPETLNMLNDLRDQTDYLRPYDLIERILTRHGGRRNLLGRLGQEAEDGINALLSQALAYERSEVPSLTGFLVWMETDDLEIKRQMGGADDMVRVMTVHGAKGLESPIVILPDTGPRRAPNPGEIMMAGGKPLWRTNADQMPEALTNARDLAREKQMNERLRLLYVALTRAEKWLIVAMAGDLDKNGDSWYQMVEAVMTSENAQAVGTDGQTIRRLEHGDWAALGLVETQESLSSACALPEVFSCPAPPPPTPPQSLSPSDLGGAKALPGDQGLEEDAAMLRGTRIHLLLELLPQIASADRPDAARNILPDVPDIERADLVREVEKVLNTPDLSYIFAPDSLAEVPVTANLGTARMHGIIDRLLISPDHVLIVDFKTNATVPADATACPEGVLRQIGAYAMALAEIYPNHQIETAILWTAEASLMPLPHDLVSKALARTPYLDGAHPRS
jgi:ATP-dependent helicase/nuclease subunit A